MNFELSYADASMNVKVWIDKEINKAIQELREGVEQLIFAEMKHSIYSEYYIQGCNNVLALIGEKKC